MTGREATPPCGPGGRGLPHQPDERGYCPGCTGLFDGVREAFDYRTRCLDIGPVRLFASDPQNGLGERMPRVRSLLVGPWKVTLERRRDR